MLIFTFLSTLLKYVVVAALWGSRSGLRDSTQHRGVLTEPRLSPLLCERAFPWQSYREISTRPRPTYRRRPDRMVLYVVCADLKRELYTHNANSSTYVRIVVRAAFCVCCLQWFSEFSLVEGSLYLQLILRARGITCTH